MKATHIVYVSNTGYTARYAALLSARLGLPAHPLDHALKELPTGTPVIHLGWLMAGSVKGYRKAAKRFAVQAVVGVGLGDTGAQDAAARKACGLPEGFPVFTVQGGMDLAALKGPYRFAIRMLTKGLSAQKNRTPGDERMLQLLLAGGDYVNEKNLAAVLAWAAE
ncbi:MAG: hypothetical protein IJ343_02025 [Clostridia bacterium]|nr:hypothetical protein [Clostridia bacterium]